MMKTTDIFNKYKCDTTVKWREEDEYRRKNSRWLRYSAIIALQVRDRMSQIGMPQVVLAEKLGCTQQHISMLLKGMNNLIIETIARFEESLYLDVIGDALTPVAGYNQDLPSYRKTGLSELEQAPYGKDRALPMSHREGSVILT